MSFEIRGVENIGDLERERVVLRAKTETPIGHYAVFRCNPSDDGRVLSGDIPSAYWFEDKTVKSGDFVVLYTKGGQSSEKVNSGNTSHFFYWGKSAAQWDGFLAVVVETGGSWFKSDLLNAAIG